MRRRTRLALRRARRRSPSCSAPRAATSGRTRGWSRARSPSPGSRCSPTTRTSGPRCRRSGTRWACTAPRCATTAPSTSPATRFSGLPGVIIGHNDRIAWGFTNLGARRRRPLPRTRRRRHATSSTARWSPLTLREEIIEVAGGDPVTDHRALDRARPDRHRHQRRLRRGRRRLPRGIRAARRRATQLSLQWTALTPGTHRAGRSSRSTAPSDWNAFRAAAALFDVPSQNLVYADVDGNIGYQAPGASPSGMAGDGTVPLPGWTSANGWSGTIPFDELPSVLNPAAGYIVDRQQRGQPAPTARCSPRTGTSATAPRRIDRLLRERIAAGEKLTADDLAEIQLDTRRRERGGVPARDRRARPRRRRRPRRGAPRRLGRHGRRRQRRSRLLRGVLAQPPRRHVRHRCPKQTRPVGGDRWFSVVGTLLGEPDSTVVDGRAPRASPAATP